MYPKPITNTSIISALYNFSNTIMTDNTNIKTLLAIVRTPRHAIPGIMSDPGLCLYSLLCFYFSQLSSSLLG